MGALLRGIKREQIKRGQVIIAPGSMKAVKKFQAQIYVRHTATSHFQVTEYGRFLQVLTKDEGGRYTPFMANYTPQLFLRTADISTQLSWPEGTSDAEEKMVMPGDNVEMVCTLHHDVAGELGSR